MNLTIEILSEELERELNCKTTEKNKGSAEFDCVLLYKEGYEINQGACYVSDGIPAQVSEQPFEALFVLCGNFSSIEANELPYDTICFNVSQEKERVLNAIQHVFKKYNRWENELREILYSTGSAQEMFSVSTAIFGNRLVGVDSTLHAILLDAPKPIEDKLPEEEIMDEFMHDKIKDFKWNLKSHSPVYQEIPGYLPNCALNLFEQERFLGNISVSASHHSLHKCDGQLLIKLGDFIRKAIMIYGFEDIRSYDRLGGMLANIINGEDIDASTLASVARFSGIGADDTFRCIAIEINQTIAEEYIHLFFRRMGAKLPLVYVPINGSYAIAILNEKRAERQGIDIFASLKELLDNHNLQAGISESYGNLMQTKFGFLQSSIALNTVKENAVTSSIVLFDDCWLDYVLDCCTEDLPSSMLWPTGFSRLVEHDEMGRASYIETLKAYLNNNMNSKKAAAELNITRNSFLSRLERIEKLLKLDINDPLIRFRLMFCLLLREHGD